MLSRATWRDREKSSTLRSKSVLSLMQNWAAASLMVSCGGGHQSDQNPHSPLPCPDLLTPHTIRQMKLIHLDACLGFDTMQHSEGGRQRSAPTASWECPEPPPPMGSIEQDTWAPAYISASPSVREKSIAAAGTGVYGSWGLGQGSVNQTWGV